LCLGFIARIVQRSGPCIERRLAPGLLRMKHLRPRLAQPLLVFGRARLGRGNVSPRLLHRALCLAAPLLEHTPQWLVHNYRVEQVEQGQQNHRRHGSEQ
jgi:hypothetical protein